MFVRMGNTSSKGKRSGGDDDSLYPAENAVAELLARAYRSQNDEDSREPTPIPSPSTEERQQRALVRMSADLLSERQRREKLEEDKYELRGELTQIKRDMKLRNTLIADGLETAQPDEIASKFLVLRERQRKLQDENELLRTRLRETNESVIKSDGKQNSMIRELKIASEQSDRYLEELGKLSKRLKDQKKLEDLCKEQEKIISKLEDLFSKTRINIDSRWKDDVERMITMTQTRERYNPDMYNVPIYPTKPVMNQMLDVNQEIEQERFRSNLLERQINEMARGHAREKQDLVHRLEELKLGYGDGRIYDRRPERDDRRPEREDTRNESRSYRY